MPQSLNIIIESINVGEKQLIENFSLTLDLGSIQLLKAPNGTGKSVLLSILAGWDNHIISSKISATYTTHDKCFDLPEDIKEYRKYAKKKIGYLSHKLFEESLGVKFSEEIDFVLSKYKSIPKGIDNTINYLKANNNRNLLVENMSKGHRQLLAIIDVLSEYENYDLLLLDEPTSYLSDTNLDYLIQQIRLVSRTSNCAIIIASNDERLLSQEFTQISLLNRERELQNFYLPTLATSLKIDSISIKIKGYPIGSSGKLPFYFDEEIAGDESVLIVGANGCGKTTFLNVCAGFMPIKGKVEYYSGNKKIKKTKLFPNYISLLFQEPQNYEFRDLPSEILCQLEEYKDLDFFKKLYDETLSYYGIPQNQNPKTLSSGQLRMLWLISMLGWSGRWILDEPDASLDAKSLELFFRILDIHIANNGSVLIVTHNKELYKNYNFRTIKL